MLEWLKKLVSKSEEEKQAVTLASISPIHPVKNKPSILVHAFVQQIECRDCGAKSGEDVFQEIQIEHTCGGGFEILDIN